MTDQTLLTALGALADEWEADSAEAREGGPVRMVVGRCCADLRALIAAHQSAEPERCGWCQQAMNSKPAFDCRNPSHSPAHQCVELSEGNSTEPIDFREEIDASERTDTAEACSCGAPDTTSLNPAEVVVHRTDGPCYIAPAQPSEPDRGERDA